MLLYKVASILHLLFHVNLLSLLLILFITQSIGKNLSNTSPVARSKPPYNASEIPRILHHIYLKWKTERVTDPLRYKQWMQRRNGCVEMTPGFKHILWDDVMVENLIELHYHWLLETYRIYPYLVQRADVARLLVLHHMGGIYIDMDGECRADPDQLLVSMETAGQSLLLRVAQPFGTSNDIIVATQRNDFLAYCIDKLISTNKSYVLPYLTVLMSAGTLFVNSRRREYMKAYPEARFRLLSREERRTVFGFKGGSSWHQFDGTIIMHLYRHSKFYCVFVLIICVASAFVWYRRRNARMLLASVRHIFPPKNVRHFYEK